MRRNVVLTLAAALAVAVAVAAPSGPADSVALVPVLRTKSAGMMAIFSRPSVRVANASVEYLARLDPRALQPRRRSPRLVLGSDVSGWSFSPDRSQLAVGVYRRNKAFIRLVDPSAFRVTAEVGLGKGWAYPAIWSAPARLLVFQYVNESLQAVLVDPEARQVLDREPLPAGDVFGAAATSDGFVFLLASRGQIGRVTLAVVDAQATVRAVTLDQIEAGSIHAPEASPQEPVVMLREPGLAIDPEGRRAIVVGADEPAAEISLTSLAVTYHSLSRPISLLGRVHDWIEPKAEAKAWEGPTRYARWVGNGLVAVSGGDAETYTGSDGDIEMRYRPAGLQLIDTDSWSVRTLDSGADSFQRFGGDLLATGSTWDSSSDQRPGIGLVDYGPDGSRRFTALDGQALYLASVFRNRAYVYDMDGSTAQVVDLRNGKVVGQRLAPLPWLLDRQSSGVPGF